MRYDADKVVKHGYELLVFEYPMHTVHDEVLVDTLVELGDVELVTEPCALRVFLYVAANVLHQVVHSPVLDACGGRSDEPLLQMLIHHRHDGMDGDAVLQFLEELNVP